MNFQYIVVNKRKVFFIFVSWADTGTYYFFIFFSEVVLFLNAKYFYRKKF